MNVEFWLYERKQHCNVQILALMYRFFTGFAPCLIKHLGHFRLGTCLSVKNCKKKHKKRKLCGHVALKLLKMDCCRIWFFKILRARGDARNYFTSTYDDEELSNATSAIAITALGAHCVLPFLRSRSKKLIFRMSIFILLMVTTGGSLIPG